MAKFRTALAACALLAISFSCEAAKVTVVGLFPNKAVLVIDGAPPRTMSVGQTSPEGVKLIAVGNGNAVVEIEGQRQTLDMGEHFATSSPGANQSVTLAADARGHFNADGKVNGRGVRFLVDTGATLVALPGQDARRLGIDYRKGEQGTVQTAAGPAPAFKIRLDTVQVGDVLLYQVDGVVIETGLEIALLGMSFLNRTEMRREGQNMVLTKRF